MVESSSLPPPYPLGSDAEAKHNNKLPPPPAPATQPPIPTPPATDRRSRRPRAREVSSRYLSPSLSSSSSSSSSSSESQHPAASPRNACPSPSLTPLLSKKHHQQKPHPCSHPFSPDPEPAEADENHFLAPARRSSETPLPFASAKPPPAILKKRAVVRLFTDHNTAAHAAEPPPKPADLKRRPRPGILLPPHPVADNAGVPRTNPRPPTPARVTLFPFKDNSCGHGSGDNHLPDEAFSENSFIDSEACSISSQGGLCDSPPLLPPSSCRSRPPAEVRSSMPEADFLPTMSARRQDAAEDSSCRASTNSFCFRSVTSAISGRQHPFNLSKSVNRPLFSSKPPQPPSTKSGTDAKKGRKASSRQEDVHVLRLLDNHHVQWRFINAKARGAVETRRVAAEKSLHGLSARVAELQSSVTEKRIQLEQLKRREGLLSIIRSQMWHLEEWTILEDDYSSSLLGATKALQDASLRLPITGNVRVDVRQIKEVLDYALFMLESLSPRVAKFLAKAADVDDVASHLASVISIQRGLVEECGNLLSEAHKLQVKECSLRSQLIQAKQSNI